MSEFSYRAGRDNVFIAWRGRDVTTLSGKDASRFLGRVEGGDEERAQLEMARVTGNFKRGNEKT